MQTKFIFCFVLLCFSACIANAKKKKNSGDVLLVEAYTQRTVPGVRPRPGQPPPAPVTHFIIVWEGGKTPDAFYFWAGDTILYQCSIAKAHKIVGKSPAIPPGKDYYTENMAPAAVRKGDTLQLALYRGKPLDESVFPKEKNCLLFTTGGGGWMSYHIDTIIKKRDILMP